MSCGCGSTGGGAGTVQEEQPDLPSYQLPSETIECYMARSQGTPTAAVNTLPVGNIATLNILVDCAMKTNTTFTMTPGSQPVTWSFVMKDDQGNEVQPSDLGLTYDNGSGKLTGTFKDQYEKKV